MLVLPPLVLAPLAGYSDLPFRRICREEGAGLCFSEMVSCHGLCRLNNQTRRLLASSAADHPLYFQLFGSEPDTMAEAAAILAGEYRCDGIDINMGCPVKKVVKKGAGAALMNEPALAARIIGAVVRRVSLPVTVKIRSGWRPESINAPDFAAMAETEGAAAVTVHGRTWSQGFGGKADWEVVRRVKERLHIPVIGNGDVGSFAEARERMSRYGCDAVMIGRAALGNPWVFNPRGRPTEILEIARGLARHLALIEETASPDVPADRFLGAIKNHAGRYFSGCAGATLWRAAIHAAPTFAALRRLVEEVDGVNPPSAVFPAHA